MCQLIHEYELHFLVGEKAGAQVAEKPIPISQGGDLEDVLRKDFFPGKPLMQITHQLYHAKLRSGP